MIQYCNNTWFTILILNFINVTIEGHHTKLFKKYFNNLSISHKNGPKVPKRLTDVRSGFPVFSNDEYELWFFTALLNTEYNVCKNYSTEKKKNMTEGGS